MLNDMDWFQVDEANTLTHAYNWGKFEGCVHLVVHYTPALRDLGSLLLVRYCVICLPCLCRVVDQAQGVNGFRAFEKIPSRSTKAG